MKGHLYLFDTSSNFSVCKVVAHADSIIGLAFAPHDALLCSGALDTKIQVWGVDAALVHHHTVGVHSAMVMYMCFYKQWLISCADDSTVSVVDPETGTVAQMLR